jgi:hypothetical protein
MEPKALFRKVDNEAPPVFLFARSPVSKVAIRRDDAQLPTGPLLAAWGWMNRIRIVPTTVALALCLAASACRKAPDPPFTQLAEARRLADDLRLQLAKASDASDRAVMAETDEESMTYARQAEQAAGAIESRAATISARLQSLGYAPELRAVQEFTDRFAAYRKLDHDLLDLAVQNTNLKAQRLSFGPVRQTADAFRDDLQGAVTLAPAKDRCRVDGLVARAELAVREIQILQAPHIAEPDEAAMTKIEAQMTERSAAARKALEGLGAGASAAMAKQLEAASLALGRFDKLSAELVALSRRNSNVRSLTLALRRAPELVAACDGSLAVLQEALAKEGFSGTR